MRRSLVVALTAVACLGLTAVGHAQQTSDTRPGIAVFPFENGGSYGADKENFALLGIALQQTLTYELRANTNLRVIDRASLRELLAEQNLGASGRVDAATAARIGRTVGAKYVINGGFIDLYGDFTLTGKIVDVETSEVLHPAQARGPRTDLNSLIVRLAADLTNGVKLPELPAATREARIKRQIPPEALMRHGLILSYRDQGNTAEAIKHYRQLINDFPHVEEWQAELRQLTGG